MMSVMRPREFKTHSRTLSIARTGHIYLVRLLPCTHGARAPLRPESHVPGSFCSTNCWTSAQPDETTSSITCTCNIVRQWQCIKTETTCNMAPESASWSQQQVVAKVLTAAPVAATCRSGASATESITVFKITFAPSVPTASKKPSAAAVRWRRTSGATLADPNDNRRSDKANLAALRIAAICGSTSSILAHALLVELNYACMLKSRASIECTYAVSRTREELERVRATPAAGMKARIGPKGA